MELASISRTARYIIKHPFNRDRKVRALFKWIQWQVLSRLSKKMRIHQYVNNTRLYASRGMQGVVGNIYCGLHEWEEMCFTLHFLRPEDWFADIGANVGTYTILASGASNASTYAFEPTLLSYEALCSNVRLNNLENKVLTYNIGLSDHSGTLMITTSLDSINHIVMEPNNIMQSAPIQVERLDEVIKHIPSLMKIDVEGYEFIVLRGAEKMLNHPEQEALIVEWNDSNVYGSKSFEFFEFLTNYGYVPVRYEPYSRQLTVITINAFSNNVIFVKNLSFCQERVQSAARFKIQGKKI